MMNNYKKYMNPIVKNGLLGNIEDDTDNIILYHLFISFRRNDAIQIYKRYSNLFYRRTHRFKDKDDKKINKLYDKLLIRYVSRYYEVDLK